MSISARKRRCTSKPAWCRLILIVLLLSLSSLSRAELKYVFLMIGDGMGEVQREIYSQYLRATVQDGTIEPMMNQLPWQGLTRTHSANSAITDSAAAGTAIACSVKTNNGMLGQDPKGKVSPTIAERLHKRGMKIGIISSVPLDHATPGAFYAHGPNRNDSYDISMQLATSDFEYFAAAPAAGFHPSIVQDRRHPLDAAGENGFTVITDREPFMELRPDNGKTIVSIPVDSDWHWTSERNSVMLAELVDAGIDYLDNENGFFMMVEGGAIDKRCHANDLTGMLGETASFDRAVARVRAFYDEHPKETLIIVTADHETGGMRIDIGEPSYIERFRVIDTQRGAYYELAQELGRFKAEKMPFEQAVEIIERCYGFGELNETLAKQLQNAYGWATGKDDPTSYVSMYGHYDPLLTACEHISSTLAGVRWTTFGHSGNAVVTSAIGVGAEAFAGYYDNTEIGKKILKVFETSCSEAPAGSAN